MDEVARAKDGDREAFGRLVGAHLRGVVAVTLAVTGDVGLAEDAAQDAFVTAWRRLGELEDPARFGPWVRQIARNRAKDGLRADRRATARAERAPSAPAAPDPEACASAAEDRAAVAEALAGLAEDDRELLVLHYRDELGAREVGAALGLGEGAVRQRLVRARGRLRAGLEEPLAGALRRTAPGAALLAGVLALLTPRPASASAPRPYGASPALAGLLAVALGLLPAARCLATPAPSGSVAGVAAPEAVRAVAPTASPGPTPPGATTRGPAPDPALEAMAALAGDGIPVACEGDLPVGEVDVAAWDESRVVGGRLYGVADAPRGSSVATPGVRDLLRGAGGAWRVTWDPAGCRVEAAVPATVTVRVTPPDAEVEPSHPCTRVPGDGDLRIAGWAGLPCEVLVDGRAVPLPPFVDGATVAVTSAGPAEGGRRLVGDEALGLLMDGVLGADGAFGRALARTDLSDEARALLEAWQGADADVVDGQLPFYVPPDEE